MKKLTILAFVLCFGILFTGCNKKDDKNSSSQGVVKDVVSNIESGINDVGSNIESGFNDVMSDINDNRNSSTAKAASGNIDVSVIDHNALSALDNTNKGWGQGKEVDDANRPTSCLTFQEKYKSANAYFIGENTKNIYLTFDEGYENGYTSKILDILKDKNCPAVFFVTMPYVKENPDLIQRMIDEGHVVGNHTANHPSMPSVSIDQGANEIAQLHSYLEQTFNYSMTLFRPPMGQWSERTLELTKQLGYKSVFWSFAYKDWVTDEQPEQQASLQKITAAAHNGAIYLLHAVSSTNTAILGDFIDNLRDSGYQFSTLS